MTRLWDKGGEINAIMHRLTVGNDPSYDQRLLRWDCMGSAAQAKSLQKMGILSADETTTLLNELRSLMAEADAGSIHIPVEWEDAHTTLESLLVERVGSVGKKLHTGRSRNDQIILTLRLYLRDIALIWIEELLAIADVINTRYQELSQIALPGYTHLQPAMPSSVGMWLHAFLEGSIELIRDGLSFFAQIDRSPLGASAGFGSSLPIDREYIAELLQFSCAQRSFIDIQNSRGRYEERLLFWGVQVGALWEKFAWDVQLYATHEFGFFSLPDALTTGSSIMPQKKNPDIVELLRGRCAKMRGYLAQLQWITAKLPSNYHRDLQLSKEPLFQGVEEIHAIFASVKLIVTGLRVHPERIALHMPAELFATYEAYRQVQQGVPFRDAYRATAALVESGSLSGQGYDKELAQINQEVAHYFAASLQELAQHKQQLANLRLRLAVVETSLFL